MLDLRPNSGRRRSLDYDEACGENAQAELEPSLTEIEAHALWAFDDVGGNLVSATTAVVPIELLSRAGDCQWAGTEVRSVWPSARHPLVLRCVAMAGESDGLRNFISGLALLVAVGALVVSYWSYQSSEDANDIAQSVAETRGALLKVIPVGLNLKSPTGNVTHTFTTPESEVVDIPLDLWQSAGGGQWGGEGGHRVLVKLINDGQKDARISEVFFGLGVDGARAVGGSGPALGEQCGPVKGTPEGELEDCPAVLAPEDGVELRVNIPESYVKGLTEAVRAQGIILCVSTTTVRTACSNLEIAVPPELID